MRYRRLYGFLILTLATVASAQVVPDPCPANTFSMAGAQGPIALDHCPARILGHAASTPAEQAAVVSLSPNSGALGGLFLPQGLAVDTRGSTPTVYAADSGNNRVLVWQNASSKSVPSQPTAVIGQPNLYTTLPAINVPAISGGLNNPTGLVVDPSSGALYIADTRNNRVLRYPNPQSANPTPDLVLGQPDPFTSHCPNQGQSPPTSQNPIGACFQQAPAPTANTLWLNQSNVPIPTALFLDSTGLYVADPGNNRVLHYAAKSLASSALCWNTNSCPGADMVIGQTNFTSNGPATNNLDRLHLATPAGIAIDSGGRIFVSDAWGRVVVFPSPGALAIRLAGLVFTGPPGPSASSLAGPTGLLVDPSSGDLYVADTDNSRLLIFDKYQNWPMPTDASFANPPPVAIAVLGQGPDPTSPGSFLTGSTNLGMAQPSANTFQYPVATALAGTDLYVADAYNNRVLIFDTSAGFGSNAAQSATATQKLGQSGFVHNSPNGLQGREFYFGQYGNQFDAGIAVDDKSDPPHLYISDPNNHRVLAFADAHQVGLPGVTADVVLGEPDRFTAACNYGGVANLSSQLPRQPTASSLCYPTGLAVDPGTGDLYVADSNNGRVLRFPAPFAPGQPSPEPADLVLGQMTFAGIKNPNPSANVMAFPYGVVFDPARGLLVSDLTANRVLLFPKSSLVNFGAASTVFGQPNFVSQNTNILSQPHHIAEDSNGELYVADYTHGQVQIFNVDSGQLVTTLTGPFGASLNFPQAVWVNPNKVAGYRNDIWVGDGSGISRYPVPSPLGTGNTPSVQITAATLQGRTHGGSSLLCNNLSDCGIQALAIAQDSSGTLYVADASNRVAVHYPSLFAQNAATFACAMAAVACPIPVNPPQFYLAPDGYAALYPYTSSVQFPATTTSNSAFPVPTTLGGLQVLVNGQPSPISFVSPGQINFVVPWNAPTSGTAPVQVVAASTSQVLASGTVAMSSASPGFFIRGTNAGSPQIAGLNQDNTINSSTNLAKVDSVVQLFGTGQGLVTNAPRDGDPGNGQSTASMPMAFIGGSPATVAFSGLAPGFVGLWQVNIQIPHTPVALQGFPVNVFPVLLVYKGLQSNTSQNNANPATAATIAIKAQ